MRILSENEVKEIESALGVLEKFGASVERDNFGQIVVYSNLINDDCERLCEIEEDDDLYALNTQG